MSWPPNVVAGGTYKLRYPEDKRWYDPEIILPDYLTIELPEDWPKDRDGNYDSLGWSCKKLSFGTGCVIDLSPKEPAPGTPPKGRRGDDGRDFGQNGADGEKGTNGSKGMRGVDLALIVSESIDQKGSLFINIDGGPGGDGGDGGDGGNAQRGDCDFFGGGVNGGNGGNGGNAGIGGDGGDTSKVMLDMPKLADHQEPPHAYCRIYDGDPTPTTPPQEQNDGIIWIYGVPGRGGRGGTGGLGGRKGAGDNCGLGRTDRHEGLDGARGRDATTGGGGSAPCFKGQAGTCRAPQTFPPKP
jgi:hypothetical protein